MSYSPLSAHGYCLKHLEKNLKILYKYKTNTKTSYRSSGRLQRRKQFRNSNNTWRTFAKLTTKPSNGSWNTQNHVIGSIVTSKDIDMVIIRRILPKPSMLGSWMPGSNHFNQCSRLFVIN